MTIRGVYYIGVGDGVHHYLTRNVESLRRFHPDIPITIATDLSFEKFMQRYGKLNATYMRVAMCPEGHPWRDRPDYPDLGYLAKVYWITTYFPYDITLFLDHDTYIMGNLDELFDVLDYGRFDLMAAHDVGRNAGCPLADEIPLCATNFNTGVMMYRKNLSTSLLFEKWYKKFLDLGAWGDQPAFMFAVMQTHSLRFWTLPNEYNFRFIYPNAPYMDVKILHGRSDDYESIAKNVNKISNTGRLWFMDKNYGYYDNGELKFV